MRNRSEAQVRIIRQTDPEPARDVAGLEGVQRLAMMWQLALDAWAFKGEREHAESRLQRHVVRIHRGRR